MQWKWNTQLINSIISFIILINIFFQFSTGTPTSSDPYALSPHNNGNYHSSGGSKSRPLLHHSQRSRSISPSASPTRRSRSRSKSPGNHHHVTLNAKASGSGHANVSITHHHHCCSSHGGHMVGVPFFIFFVSFLNLFFTSFSLLFSVFFSLF